MTEGSIGTYCLKLEVIMNKKRQLIWDKSNGRCWYCGCKLPEKGWQADHFHSVIRVEGKMLYPELDTIDNLVPSCAPCNNFKSSSSIEGMRFRVDEQFDNVPKNSTGMRQLMRMGLVEIERKPIQFWFESQGFEIKSEFEICGISREAREVHWNKDASEPQYFHQWFGEIMVTLRQMGSYWLCIAIKPDWDTSQRIELSNGRLVKEQAAEWAFRITK